ncbi:MAG: phosphoglycerate kinase [Rickettsiales endosymbiont of Dermacentor nuttalli]
MDNLRILQNLGVSNKTVIVRVDLNVPMLNGQVVDDNRLRKILPTIEYLLSRHAKIILLSHFGRPKGNVVPEMSLKFLLKPLSEMLNRKKIHFVENYIEEDQGQFIRNMQNAEIILMENLRFYPGETANDDKFVKKLAKLGQIYINDSFSCSHRAHASIVGLAQALPSAAGLLLQEEIKNLQSFWKNICNPIMAIVGGAKISTKLELLYHLLEKVNVLVIGGAMANSFLKAQDINIGKSLYEENLLEEAQNIIVKARELGCELILPIDVVVANNIHSGDTSKVVDILNVDDNSVIADLGPKTTNMIKEQINYAKSLVWNGPLGAFEYPPFEQATVLVARKVIESTATGSLLSLAGGGDILAALKSGGLAEGFSYISTGGGAFLEWLQGDNLPGIEVLCNNAC